MIEPKLIKNIRTGKVKLAEISKELGYLPDEIQVSVDYLGKKRKIGIFNPQNITPYIDISTEIGILQNGHPKFEDINAYCIDLLDTILSEIGLERYDRQN